MKTYLLIGSAALMVHKVNSTRTDKRIKTFGHKSLPPAPSTIKGFTIEGESTNSVDTSG